jgi:ankyrin repeat protein
MKLKFYFKYAALLVLASWISIARAGAYEDFFAALERDDARTVTALLQRGFDPNSRNPEGQVAFFLALRQPAPAVAEALWAHPQLQVDAVNGVGETPLMMAALRGQVGWMRRLLERGARVHQEGWSPIHYAATGPEPQAVELLLDRGAPVDARSPNGTTPLMMAARYGSERSVALLLQRGADRRLRNQRDLDAADFAREAGREALARQLAAPTGR